MESKILHIDGLDIPMGTVKKILEVHDRFETEGLPELMQHRYQDGQRDALEEAFRIRYVPDMLNHMHERLKELDPLKEEKK